MPGLRSNSAEGNARSLSGVEQDDLVRDRRRARPSRRPRRAGCSVVRTRSRPASVSTVTTCRAPIYSTPNTSPRTPASSARRTCSGRTPRTSPAGRVGVHGGNADLLAAQPRPRSRPAGPAGQEVHGRAADELRHEHAARPVVDLERRARLQHLALVHHRDHVGHRHGLDLVVGDVDRGGVDPVVQAAQLLAHQLAEGGVERAQRLVHQERLGPADDGAAERHALPVAAGEAADRAGRADGRCAGASPSPRPGGGSRRAARPGRRAESRCSGARSCAGRARTAGTRRRCRARGRGGR